MDEGLEDLLPLTYILHIHFTSPALQRNDSNANFLTFDRSWMLALHLVRQPRLNKANSQCFDIEWDLNPKNPTARTLFSRGFDGCMFEIIKQ